jgi:hypothetical protein
MAIDWDLVIKIAVPLATLVLGRWLDQIFAKKPKLISYVGHVSSFTVQNQNQPPTVVNTHAIVIRNAGRVAANNVRIGHHTLPDYQIFPAVPHNRLPLQNGGTELHIPKLVPGEQVTISYLYFPPLTWDRVNSYTKSDEGFARILTVIPTPLPPRWLVRTFWSLVFIGATAVLYVVVIGIRALLQ